MICLKRLLFVIALSCIHCDVVFSQQFGTIFFDNIPQESQLFARNSENYGQIPIKGSVFQGGYAYVSALLKREGQHYAYQRGEITYNGSKGTFSIPNLQIMAESAEYDCNIYLVNGKDSSLVLTRQHLVAGDFFVVNGQSNAYAFNIGNDPFYFDNKYIRPFGQNMGSASDTLWSNPSPQIGAWALALQKYIVQNTGIPTCFINGAVPGTSIAAHFKDENNPTNLGTIYGSLLYRIQKAQARDHIRAFFWAQGENDTFEHSTTYPEDFKRLHQSWLEDFPKVEQFIIFQNNVLPLPALTGASIRNFQRLTPINFSKTQVFSQVGIETIDGIHHSNKGYFQIASDLFKMIAPLFYGAADDINNHSPNIKRAYFKDAQRNSIALEFPAGTEMIAVPDTTLNSISSGKQVTLGIKDYIFFDNDESKVVSISKITYESNRVNLFFDKTVPYSKIDYLPNRYYTDDFHQFMGPCLRSKNYVNACSFYDLTIDNENTAPLNSPKLTSISGAYFIKLMWNAVDRAENFEIELFENGSYRTVATLSSTILDLTKASLSPNTLYQIRIRAVSSTASSEYAYLEIRTKALLTTPNLAGAQISIKQNLLTWQPVAGVISYELERNSGNGSFLKIASLDSTATSYKDIDINFGMTYTYRMKAIGKLTESETSSCVLKVQNALNTPALKQNSIYTYASGNSTVKLEWNTVLGANKYQVDRRLSSEGFQTLATLDSTVSYFEENNLSPNTVYLYRIKATGNLSESSYDTLVVSTPSLLDIPILNVVENLEDRVIKLTWNTIANATHYQISRSIDGQSAVVNKKTQDLYFVDSTFIQQAKYNYTLQAFSANAESPISGKSITSSLILANEPLSLESMVYPNPCSDHLSVRLPYLSSGQLDLIDSQGRTVQTFDFKNQEIVEVSLMTIPSGIYFTRVQTLKAIWIAKILVSSK